MTICIAEAETHLHSLLHRTKKHYFKRPDYQCPLFPLIDYMYLMLVVFLGSAQYEAVWERKKEQERERFKEGWENEREKKKERETER